MSRCLATRGIDHVVLERGTAANTWKTERWDSLTLLTPNWQSRLPDYRYEGDDPDGYMTMPEVISFIEGYAAAIDARRSTRTRRSPRCSRDDDGFVVETDQGDVAQPDGRARIGALQHRAHPGGRRAVPPGDHDDHAVAVPHAGTARGGRRAGGRRGRNGHPARGRDPAIGPSGDRWRSVGTSARRACTEAWTSSGGWT